MTMRITQIKEAKHANKKEVNQSFVYPELSYEIMGIIFEVGKTLGPGLKNQFIRTLLLKSFRNLGIKLK